MKLLAFLLLAVVAVVSIAAEQDQVRAAEFKAVRVRNEVADIEFKRERARVTATSTATTGPFKSPTATSTMTPVPARK